ncbi:MAG: helix-turn-helix domain-containing protein [Pseudomonadota bacterium]
MSASHSKTTPTTPLVACALSTTDIAIDKIQLKSDVLSEELVKKEIDDCLSIIVSRYLATYLQEHKDHLPVGQLYALVMGEVEKSLLKETLALTDGNQRKASEILGINRNTLRKKITDEG